MSRTARLILAAAGLLAIAAAPTGEWLSLCAKCLSPSITSSSGIGTNHAVADAKISRKDAEAWCANWQPDSLAACVKESMASEDARKSYRASADCTAGRITAVDGDTYTLAGVWTNDIGRGRTKWRDSHGTVLGQDNASNGLGIAQQWEVLCPGVTRVGGAGAAKPVPAVPNTAAAPPGAAFAVGQRIEAKYFSDWVPARVVGVQTRSGPSGAQFAYEVILDNGKHGVVPARMIRPIGAR